MKEIIIGVFVGKKLTKTNLYFNSRYFTQFVSFSSWLKSLMSNNVFLWMYDLVGAHEIYEN